jgi:beta-glucanase (GH16 family)
MRPVLRLGVLIVALALSFMAPPSAPAGGIALTLEQPQLTSSTTALLSGTASGANLVRVDVWAGGRWRIQTGSVPVVAGRYETAVPVSESPTRYRVAAGMVRTGEVVVQAQPAPAPEPEPTPDPEPEPGPADDCGPRPAKADGTLWACTLAEDFTGTELDRSVWMPQTIFRSGTSTAWACYIDDPSVISVHDDALHLTVRKLPEAQPCAGQKDQPTSYVSGMVSTYRLFSQKYGRFEARIKNTATTAPGLQESFWLWPDDRYNTAIWPAAGEIDIAETYSQYPDLAIPFLHYTATDNGGPVPGLNTAWDCVAQRGEYNTFTLEWTATQLVIEVNGETCLVNTTSDPAFQKPYIVALTQLMGVGGNAYTGQAPMPASMTIDYVRVWQ